MEQAQATIRKVGSQYCVFSKDGSRKFGCFKSREAAEKRLQQIEHFKKSKGTESMNKEYNDAFTNWAKALQLGEDAGPEELGQAPDVRPRQIDVSSSLDLNGTIAGQKSPRILDQREHFPVTSEMQAQSSMIRAMQTPAVPNWYNGSLEDLRHDVWVGVLTKHPGLAQGLTVPVAVEQALALSDGQEAATTNKSSVKNPADVKENEVDSVKRPTITTASFEAKALASTCADEDVRQAIGGRLMEMIGNQEANLKAAKKLAQRLLKSGLKAPEFDELSTYLQEDVLHELLMKGTKASPVHPSDRRRELLDRLTNGG